MNLKKTACVVCTVALTGVLAAGCIPVSSQSTNAQSASQTTSTATLAQTYISSVKQVFSNIESEMEEVKKLAETADTSAIYAALDKVDQQVTDLQNITVPNGLEEVQKNYVEAAKSLAQTLRDYVSYRFEGGATASDAAAKLDAIQSAYNKGIELLKAADEIAKGLQIRKSL